MGKRSRKIAVLGFGIFLGFMGICTLVSKIIYVSALPKVIVAAPESRRISKLIEGNGVVSPGMEYGVYALPDLRVEALFVREGDMVEEGTALFVIDVADLERQITEKELEIAGYQDAQDESRRQTKQNAAAFKIALTRAQEDYTRTERDCDLAISRARENLTQAKETLEAAQNQAPDAPVSGGDAALSTYQEQLTALEQEVREANRRVEDALLDKEASLATARRQIEDAELAADSAAAGGSAGKLQLAYLKAQLAELKALLAEEGIVYAKEAGVITKVSLAVGERTGDTAGLLYAVEQEEKWFAVSVPEEMSGYITLEDTVELVFHIAGGGRHNVEGIVKKLEYQGDMLALEILFTDSEVRAFQSGTMKLECKTETYPYCVPADAVHEEKGRYYIYLAKEQEGILGTQTVSYQVSVNLLEQNTNYAAVESAALAEDSRVIVYYDKEIPNGTVLRVVQ